MRSGFLAMQCVWDSVVLWIWLCWVCLVVTWLLGIRWSLRGLFGGGFRYLDVCWVSGLGVVADLRLGSVVVV